MNHNNIIGDKSLQKVNNQAYEQQHNIINKQNNKNNNEESENESPIFNSNVWKEFSDVIGKDLFKNEKDFLNRDNLNKETVLDQKINKEIKKEGNSLEISTFIQSEDISNLENSLHVSLLDKNEENEFLSVRNFPNYDINEYNIIREKVKNNLYVITNYLINENILINEYSADKKVGPLLPLTTLIESAYLYKPEYTKEMNLVYQRLKNYICNYRTIYGDGNCYYRAVMFRYIELLILNRKSDFLKLLIIDIYKSLQTEEMKSRLVLGKGVVNADIIVQILIIILELIENNKLLVAHQVFYKGLLKSKDFDYLLILYFRYILYDYIRKNEKKLYLEQFPVLIGNLLPSQFEKDGVFDFNSFYQNYLLKMYVYAEKIIIYLTPFVLGINVKVVIFNDREDKVLKHFNFVGENKLKIKEYIFVINKKGHYENIFDYIDNKKFNYIYKFYRNEFKHKFINIDPNLLNIYTKIKNTDKNQNETNPKMETTNLTNQNNINYNNTNNHLFNKDNNIIQKDDNNIINKNNFFENNNSNMKPKTQIIKNNKKTINNDNSNLQNNTLYNNLLNPNKVYYNNKNYNNILNEHTFKNNCNNTYIRNNNNYNNYINQQNKCYICSSIYKEQNKNLKNICKECLFKEIMNQSKGYYINYLKLMLPKINQVIISDLNEFFLNKINVNINNNKYTIYQIIDELSFIVSKEPKQLLKDLINVLKKTICLLCHNDINNICNFKLKCGCNFCSKEHLEIFFRQIVENKLNYNYKCLCAYEYKPHETYQLCRFLYENNIYGNNVSFTTHLENIFNCICCRCGCVNKRLIQISVDENFLNNFIHKICEGCLKKADVSNLNECVICKKNHQFIILKNL